MRSPGRWAWSCLSEITLFEGGRPLHCGQRHSVVGTLNCERRGTERQHAFIPDCFLTVGMMWQHLQVPAALALRHDGLYTEVWAKIVLGKTKILPFTFFFSFWRQFHKVVKPRIHYLAQAGLTLSLPERIIGHLSPSHTCTPVFRD